MDPLAQSCHEPDCPARGQPGSGDLRVHSRDGRRDICSICGRTSAATRDTAPYRLKKSLDLVTVVVTRLGHGRPVQAAVAASGRDERTGAHGRDRAGRHGQLLHEHGALRGQVESGHVQADGLYIEAVGRRLRMAMAMAVASRLRPGGVVSARRDLAPIGAVVGMVRRAAKGRGLLVCVDGPASYVTASVRGSRDPVRTGRRGRPKLKPIPGPPLGRGIEHHRGRRPVDVPRRPVPGTAGALASVLSATATATATGTGTGIHTSYIERLDATFRASIGPPVRRGRAIARGEGVSTGWMSPVGCAYDCCWGHGGLRIATPAGTRPRWRERTPAMAAGLTDHRWTMHGWFSQPIPPTPWVAPRRRGRPPKRNQAPGPVAA